MPPGAAFQGALPVAPFLKAPHDEACVGKGAVLCASRRPRGGNNEKGDCTWCSRRGAVEQRSQKPQERPGEQEDPRDRRGRSHGAGVRAGQQPQLRSGESGRGCLQKGQARAGSAVAFRSSTPTLLAGISHAPSVPSSSLAAALHPSLLQPAAAATALPPARLSRRPPVSTCWPAVKLQQCRGTRRQYGTERTALNTR